jgi:serine/threonine protein kinase
VDGHRLYIAFRLMNKGSAADVMRYGWPGGMEEDVVRCILSQALSGLKFVLIKKIFINIYVDCIFSQATCTSMDSYTGISRLQIF